MNDSEHAAYLSGQFYETKQVINEQGYQLPVNVAEAVTLRDQFAMAALTGLLAGRTAGDRIHWAKIAYEFADDMMEARK